MTFVTLELITYFYYKTFLFDEVNTNEQIVFAFEQIDHET